jgi:hypothetical protein
MINLMKLSTLDNEIVYYIFYDFDGLKMSNVGWNMLP